MDERTKEAENEYFTHVEKLSRDNNQILRHLDVLNAKSSALLTHISIMIAVITAFLVTLEPSKYSGELISKTLYVELFLYILCSILCLLSIPVTEPKSLKSANDPLEAVQSIYRRRRVMFLLAWRMTIALTIAFALTILLKLYEGKL